MNRGTLLHVGTVAFGLRPASSIAVSEAAALKGLNVMSESVTIPCDKVDDALVALFAAERYFEKTTGYSPPPWEVFTQTFCDLFCAAYGEGSMFAGDDDEGWSPKYLEIEKRAKEEAEKGRLAMLPPDLLELDAQWQAHRVSFRASLAQTRQLQAEIRERERALVCVDCDARSDERAHGWRAFFDADGDLWTYCPDCGVF